MRKLFFLFIASVISSGCYAIKIDQVELLKYKALEKENNQRVEKALNAEIQDFFTQKTDSFIENEYGFFRGYGHMIDAVFMTEDEFKSDFFNIFQFYYRTTELERNLNTILSNYKMEIVRLRKNALKKDTKSTFNRDICITLPTISISSFAPVLRTHNELIDESVDLLSDRIPIIVTFVLSICGICSTSFTKGIGIAIFLLAFAYLTYKNIVYDNDMADNLNSKCVKYIEGNKVNVSKQLDYETDKFYSSLNN